MPLIVAITGGRGFIGRRLVARLLAAGHHVRILSRLPFPDTLAQGVERHHADLATPNESALLQFVDGADVLFNCAGEIHDQAKMASTNRFGTERLAACAAGRVGRWVQLSTIGVYGNPQVGFVDERTPPAPIDAYEMSKLQGDEALVSVATMHDMPWTILRPTIVFGNDMPNSSMRGFIEAVTSGKFFYIGKQRAILPYVHVDDVVEAMLLLAEKNGAIGQVFNLSDDVPLEDFVTEVCNVSGCRRPDLHLPEAAIRMLSSVLQSIPGFPLTLARVDALTRTTNYPIDKIRQFVGYTHVKGWRAGLREMLMTGRTKS